MNLDVLVRLVRPHVKDCPELLIVPQLVLAARDFCVRTEAYKPMTPVMLNAGRSRVDMPQYAGEDVISLDGIYIEGKPVRALNRKGSFLDVGAGKPSLFYIESNGVVDQIVVDRPADRRYELEVTIVAKPSLDATELSELLCNKFGEHIAIGAAAKLLLQQTYPWYNPELSGVLSGQFERAVSDAKQKVMTGMAGTNSRVYARKW